MSVSPFTYTFHIKLGPKFVQLYFFPSDYDDLNFTRSGAVFFFEAGAYILLKDFSPSLTADNLYNAASFYKEFIIWVDEDRVLGITFSPAVTMPGAYAFVNGVEVVSMPDELYYMKTDVYPGIMLIGQTNKYVVENSYALEMVNRVNVGGSTFSPGNDTGMYRIWEQDQRYLVASKQTNYCVAPEN